MSVLGLKSLPVNHPLHRVYQVTAGVVGALLVAYGIAGLLMSSDRMLGVSAGTVFCVGCLVVGAVLIGGAIAGGNAAATVNAWVGALLVAVGLLALLVLRNDDWNVVDAKMSDVIVLFVVGMMLMAAGFYGQVGPDSEH